MRGWGNKVNWSYRKWKGKTFGYRVNNVKFVQGLVEAAKIVNSVLTLQIFIAGRSWAAHLKGWHSEAVSFMWIAFSGKLNWTELPCDDPFLVLTVVRQAGSGSARLLVLCQVEWKLCSVMVGIEIVVQELFGFMLPQIPEASGHGFWTSFWRTRCGLEK